MAALRNLQIYSASVTGVGWASVYTVPTGKLVIVRNVVARNTDATATGVALRRDSQTEFHGETLGAIGSSTQNMDWSAAVALAAGQSLGLFVTVGHHIGIVISGSIYFV